MMWLNLSLLCHMDTGKCSSGARRGRLVGPGVAPVGEGSCRSTCPPMHRTSTRVSCCSGTRARLAYGSGREGKGAHTLLVLSEGGEQGSALRQVQTPAMLSDLRSAGVQDAGP